MRVASLEDDCKTADDVRARAAAVRARLKAQRERPLPTVVAAPAAVTALPPPAKVEVGPVLAAEQVLAVAEQMIAEAERLLGMAPKRSYPFVEDIIRAVSAVSGVPVLEIKSHRRTKHIVTSRQLVMGLARRLTLRSLPAIGHSIGGRDHTTVLHGARKFDHILDIVAGRLGEDAPLAAWVEVAWNELKATAQVAA